MKYTIIIICLIFGVISGYAQQGNGQSFTEYAQSNFNKSSKASADKNYKQAELLVRQVIDKYAVLPEKVRIERVDCTYGLDPERF